MARSEKSFSWYSIGALRAAFAEVKTRTAAAGLDAVTPAGFATDLETHLVRLHESLVAKTYRPKPLLRIRKPKGDGRFRRLSILSVEDRIVVEAMRTVLEPAIESHLHPTAFAYRPGKSALAAVETVCQAITHGARWVVVADIADFFDSIPHRVLLSQVSRLDVPPSCVDILKLYLQHHRNRPGVGIPQGSSLSPSLSNLAMIPVDQAMTKSGFSLVRYCDNLCITTADEAKAKDALTFLRSEVTKVGLTLKTNATQIIAVRQGFVWLGFFVDANGKRVATGALETLRKKADKAAVGLSGSLVAERLMPIVRGFLQYFRAPLPDNADLGVHGATLRALAKTVLEDMPRDDVSSELPMVMPDGDMDGGMELDDGEGPWENDEVSVDAMALLAQAEQLAAEGKFALAESCFERARALPDTQDGELVEPDPDPVFDEDRIDAFLSIFCARQNGFDVLELTERPNGERDYAWVQRPPGPNDIREHLIGRSSVAIRPRLTDGQAMLGVFDIDATSEDSLLGAKAYAESIASVASQLGMPTFLEDTGGRGNHVWFSLNEPVPADLLAVALERIAAQAGTPANGVRVEILPGRDNSPDVFLQAMALPCGLHSATGQRSRLWWHGGPTIQSDLGGIFYHTPIRTSVLKMLVEHSPGDSQPGVMRVMGSEPEWRTFGSGVMKMMEGCSVLRHLADKAAAVGHLTHSERLSLLYTLGHLESGGAKAIHTIIGKCQNYDVRETERQISRMTGLPIGCARLKEKHPLPPGVEPCVCPADNVARAGGYATPLLLAGGFRRQWREVLRGRRVNALTPEPSAGIRTVDVLEPISVPLPPHRWA